MSTPSPKYFKAWFLFFLIATVGGFLAGALMGGVLGAILGIAGVELGKIKLICGALGFVLGIPISYFTFRWTVSEFIVKELIQMPPPVIAATNPTPHNPVP